MEIVEGILQVLRMLIHSNKRNDRFLLQKKKHKGGVKIYIINKIKLYKLKRVRSLTYVRIYLRYVYTAV